MEADVKTIKKIADMAAISINEDELELYAKDLGLIIDYINGLSNLKTDDIKPMEHVSDIKNVLRDDIPTNGNRRVELMKSAASVDNGFYTVPTVVEPS